MAIVHMIAIMRKITDLTFRCFFNFGSKSSFLIFLSLKKKIRNSDNLHLTRLIAILDAHFQ